MASSSIFQVLVCSSADFPSVEAVAVKERSEPGFHLRRAPRGGKGETKRSCDKSQRPIDFHDAESKAADLRRKPKIRLAGRSECCLTTTAPGFRSALRVSGRQDWFS